MTAETRESPASGETSGASSKTNDGKAESILAESSVWGVPLFHLDAHAGYALSRMPVLWQCRVCGERFDRDGLTKRCRADHRGGDSA